MGDKKTTRIDISSKELRVNLEQLQKDVKKAYESMKKVIPEAIKNCDVKKFGNAAHVVLPKEYIGKKVTVLVKK
ncbi:MAG: DUF2080 family transposase-associated protein [archaeon]